MHKYFICKKYRGKKLYTLINVIHDSTCFKFYGKKRFSGLRLQNFQWNFKVHQRMPIMAILVYYFHVCLNHMAICITRKREEKE